MASVWAILTATRWRIGKDNLSALAAGASFQALLTIFPALTAVVSVYGLVADPNMVEQQITTMHGVLPPEAVTLIATWLQALVEGPTKKFGIGLIVSMLFALWSMWSAAGTNVLMLLTPGLGQWTYLSNKKAVVGPDGAQQPSEVVVSRS